jgi:hypothetical protein
VAEEGFQGTGGGQRAKRSDERGMCDRMTPCLLLNREETTGKGESDVTYLRIWQSLSLESGSCCHHQHPPLPLSRSSFSLGAILSFDCAPLVQVVTRKCCICASRPRSISKWIFHISHRLEACFPCFTAHFGYGAPNEALVEIDLPHPTATMKNRCHI